MNENGTISPKLKIWCMLETGRTLIRTVCGESCLTSEWPNLLCTFAKEIWMRIFIFIINYLFQDQYDPKLPSHKKVAIKALWIMFVVLDSINKYFALHVR